MSLPAKHEPGLGETKPVTDKITKPEDGKLESSSFGGLPVSDPATSSTQLIASIESDEFPRYSTTPSYSAPQHRAYPYQKAAALNIRSGPAPQKGTPQDRFRTAVLGIDEASQPVSRTPYVPTAPVPIPFIPRPFNPAMTWGDFTPGVPARNDGGPYGGPAPPAAFGANFTNTMPTAWAATMPFNAAPKTNTAHAGPRAPPVVNQTARPGQPKSEEAPTARLSTECQDRAFNPEFIESTTPNGLFWCSVRLKEQLIRPTKAYPTPSAAKLAIAERALQVIRSWPKPTKAERLRQKNDRIRCLDEQLRMITKERNDLKVGNINGDDSSQALKVAVKGAENATINVNMNNPVEARAFLEGIKVGQQLAASGTKRDDHRKDGRSRRRSRSPIENPNRSGGINLPTYRDRSDPRRHHSQHNSWRESSDSKLNW